MLAITTPCRADEILATACRREPHFYHASMATSALLPLIDLVFPPRCPLCGAAVCAQNGLCGSCWQGLVLPAEPCCIRCGRPFVQPVADGSCCATCLATPPRHDGIFAATVYNDTSRSLVLALKHGGRISLATMMARMMAARMAQYQGNWLIVPVPSHYWRLWRRGYNQAAELGRALARQLECPVSVDALVRRKHTPSLGGLGRTARRRVLRGAISVRPSRKAVLDGARIVLVDDVLTSGATSDACVSALLRAGASQVVIACFARVLDEMRREIPPG